MALVANESGRRHCEEAGAAPDLKHRASAEVLDAVQDVVGAKESVSKPALHGGREQPDDFRSNVRFSK
jgi:hypothetical protein